MKVLPIYYLALLTICLSAAVAAESGWYVVFHSPGEAWLPGKTFDEQPDIDQHIKYLTGFMEGGQLILGGPFGNSMDSMIILRTESEQAALEIAQQDPAVMAGILRFKMRSWDTPYSIISIHRSRWSRPAVSKDAPFVIGSPRPDGPINLEDQR